MKNLTPNSFRFIPAALGLLIALLANHAGATNVYWDINGATAGSGVANGGSYTWETSSWSTSSAGTVATAAWVEGNFPEFDAGSDAGTASYTVNAGSAHTIAGMLERNKSGTVTISGSTLTVASGQQGFYAGPGNLIINNVLAGTGGVVPECNSGCGDLTLNGNNTYSGGFVMGGANIVFIGNANALGTGGLFFSGVTYGFFGNDGILDFLGNYTIPNAVNMGSGVSSATGPVAIQEQFIFNDTSAHNMTFSGNWTTGSSMPVLLQFGNQGANQTFTISGNISGTTGFTNYGTGTLILTGVNSFGGTLTLNNSGTVVTIGGAGTITGGFNIANTAGGTFNYSSSAASILTGTFSGSGGTFNVTSGTFTLAGSGDNNSLGANVNGGKLVLGKTSASGVHALGAATTVNSGGTLQLGGSGGDQIFNGVTITVASGGVFDLNGQTETFTTLNLSGTGISSGGALVNNNGSTTSTLTCSSGINLAANSSIGGSANITLPSVISGSSMSLTKVGTGTLTLSGLNTYSGGTTISGGYLLINADANLGATTSPLTLNSGTGTASTTGLRFNANSITLNASRGITLGANGGCINAPSGDTETIAGVISGTLGGAFESGANYSTGTGTNVLNGANTYNGATIIAAGRLKLGPTGSLPYGTSLTIGADNGGGACFDLGGNSQTIGPLASNSGYGGSPAGPQTIVLTGPLTVLETNTSTTFGGQIIGSGGSLILNGSANQTLTLSGANTYTGATTITAGTLEGSVSGSIPGNVNNTGGTLKLDSTTAMASGATLNLASSPASGAVNLNFSGTQNISALNFGATSMAQGTWGASGAAHNNAAFTGTGLLNITSGGTAQTITFPNPGTQTYGVAPITLTATAPGGTVTYTVTSGPATVAGSTLTITGAGSVTVQANQAGTTIYNAAPANNQTFTVNAQAVTLAGNPNKIYDGTTGVAGVDLKVTNPVGSDVVTVTGTGSSGDLAGSGFGVQTINSFTGLSLGGAQAANYTLTGASGSVTITAGDTGCNDAITTGVNGGTGFVAWTGVSIGSGGGVYDTGTSPAGDLCGTAWGIYTGSGVVTTSVQRPLANSDTLVVGQSVRVDMQNGGVQSGGSEGLSLWNTSGNAVFELFFSGGATYWTINASSVSPASAIPYAGTSGGCRAIFTLTSATTYSLTVQVPIGGTNYGPYTGTLLSPTGGQSITQLRFYAYNIGGGNNLQFNDLAVGCPTFTVTTEPSPTTACAGSTASFTAASSTASSPTFQWQVSIDSGSAWNSVSTGTGGTTASYTTAATTTGMNGYEYRCVVTDGCGIAATSTVATLTVNTPAGVTLNLATDSICASSTESVTATRSGSATGGNWTSSGTGSFSSTTADSTVYTPSTADKTAGSVTLTFTTTGQSSPCGAATATDVVTINPVSVGGSATATVANLLSGLSTTITLSGNTGAIQWQSSTDGITFNNVSGGSGATTATYTTPALTQTTYYRAVVTSGVCSSANSSVATVTVSTAPAITTQPQPQTACQGSSATFTVAASGTSPSYAWYKHANAGWGSAWSATGSGTVFLGSATDNNNGAPNCNSFSSTGDINTLSSESWGLYGGTTGESAIRTFPAALTSGQLFQIDMDNGFVNTGLSVGFSLHNSANALLLSFYFQGGGSGYSYYDATGVHTTSVGYTLTGLRIQVLVGTGSPASYSLLITPCGGSSVEYSGTFATTGAPDMVLLFNNNTSGTGSDYNAYFNSMFAGAAYDNADNYVASGNWSGFDKGDQPISGATGTSYTTSTGNNGDLYYAIAFNGAGYSASTSALLTVNPLPTVSVNSATVCAGSSATLTATTSASSPGYSWSPGGATTASITVSPASTTTYTVIVTDGTTGCANSGSATVTVNDIPAAPTAGSDSPVVPGSTLHLTASTVSEATYAWTGPNGFTSNDQNPTIAGVTRSANAGTYSVTATVNSCTSAAGTTSVIVNTPPTASNSTAGVTANTSLVLSVAKLLVTARDADTGDTLSVTAAGPTSANGPANNVVLNSGAGTITYTPATDFTGTDTFTYTISDNYGGTVTPTITVTVASANVPSPNIVVPPAYDSESGTFSVTFAGIPGYTYTVQTATSPTGPWSFLKTATAGTDGLFQVLDTESPPPPARYYRTVYP